jgi:hypothetical protein
MRDAELVPVLRRYQGTACDNLRRRPDWSPERDVTVCACGATLGQHAARRLADVLATPPACVTPQQESESEAKKLLRDLSLMLSSAGMPSSTIYEAVRNLLDERSNERKHDVLSLEVPAQRRHSPADGGPVAGAGVAEPAARLDGEAVSRSRLTPQQEVEKLVAELSGLIDAHIKDGNPLDVADLIRARDALAEAPSSAPTEAQPASPGLDAGDGFDAGWAARDDAAGWADAKAAFLARVPAPAS